MDDPLEHSLVHSSFKKTSLSALDIEFSGVDVEDEQIECTLALDSLPSVSNQEERRPEFVKLERVLKSQLMRKMRG